MTDCTTLAPIRKGANPNDILISSAGTDPPNTSRCPPGPHCFSSTAAPRCTARTTRSAGSTRPATASPTNAVYGFVDDAAQAAGRPPAGVHRGVVRPGRADLPRRAGDRLQGQPRADARRPRRADPVGARGVRGAGRADPHLRALRGRRRDRHAGASRRVAAGLSTSRSSPATRTSSSSCDDGIRVYNPRDEGTWYDADGVQREVRRRARSRSWTCSR